MISPEKLKIYLRYEGNDDWFVRVASPEEQEILKDNDFAAIRNLIQDIILVKNNLTSKEYAENVRKVLAENCIDSETVDFLYNKFNRRGKFLIKKIINYIKKICVCTIISMLAASMALVGYIVVNVIIYEKHIDIVDIKNFNLFSNTFIDFLPAALLFGLFTVPSIVIYYTLDFFHKTSRAKIIGYAMPIVGMLMFFVVALILAVNGKCSEGEDQIATLILIIILFSGSVVYLFMSKITWLK